MFTYSGQMVHFERLVDHTEWATVPRNYGEVAIIMDPDPERSLEEVPDDASQPSYCEEEPISEASNASLTSRRRHWMDTRVRTRMRAGGSRLHYQHFYYSSTDSDDERSDVLLSSAQFNPDESIITTPPTNDTMPLNEIPISPLLPMDVLFLDNEAVMKAEPGEPNLPMR